MDRKRSLVCCATFVVKSEVSVTFSRICRLTVCTGGTIYHHVLKCFEVCWCWDCGTCENNWKQLCSIPLNQNGHWNQQVSQTLIWTGRCNASISFTFKILKRTKRTTPIRSTSSTLPCPFILHDNFTVNPGNRTANREPNRKGISFYRTGKEPNRMDISFYETEPNRL